MEAFATYERQEAFVPADVASAAIERGVEGVLLPREALPASFFDLKTRIAGELAQRAVQYYLCLAFVVPDLDAQSDHFRAFAREANRGNRVRFFGTRSAAVSWLESVEDASDR